MEHRPHSITSGGIAPAAVRVLLFSCASLAFAWAPFAAAQVPGSPQETGPGERTREEVRVDLIVEGTGTTATGAISDVRFRTRTVSGALGQSGATIRDLTVGEVHLTPIFETRPAPPGRRPPRPPRVVGYAAWASITFVTPSTARIGRVLDAAEGAGGYVQVLRYGSDPETGPLRDAMGREVPHPSPGRDAPPSPRGR